MAATAVQTGIDARLREVAKEAVASHGYPDAPSDPALTKLRQLGTELWLDTGDLEGARALWHREMSALTTNNTLANQVVQTGVLDDEVRSTIRELVDTRPDLSEDEMVMELGFVVNCHVALRLVKAFGAMVSVELHPAVSQSIDRTVHYAERYYAVCPERFYIKIPLTPEGYCAVARVRQEGIPVNFTLGFSARQNYLAARLSDPTFVNVFLGRLNNVVAENGLGDGKHVGEKSTLASQAALRELRDAGRSASRQIAASMREAGQVSQLTGVDVFTMPTKVAKGFLESQPDPATLTSQLGTNLDVHLAAGVDPAYVAFLWEVDDGIRALAEDLWRRGPTKLAGDDLREADKDHGTGLFHSFSSAEVVDIREQGKIPKLSRWADTPGIALDDLMTQSALQSFAVDQAALDAHLQTLTRRR